MAEPFPRGWWWVTGGRSKAMSPILSGVEPFPGLRCRKSVRTLEGSSRLVDGEAAVIARVRAGEREAYADLVRAHTRIAHRTAVLLGAGADAEDVVQSAFL